MNEVSHSQDQRRLNIEDATGETNLCRCYTMDSDGNYDNPCFTPPDDCC